MKLKVIKKNKRKVLDRMIQLYLHDISSYFSMDFDSKKGLYIYESLDKYFDDTDNFAYFILNDESDIAGFILVDKNENSTVIQEMFVLNNYKGKGIGKLAVNKIFDNYKGQWTVKSLPGSAPAENFWYKTIKNYTNNNFNLEHVGKYNRAVFTFNNEKYDIS